MMNTLLAAALAGLVTAAVCAPLVRFRYLPLILFPAIGFYLAGRVIWLFGIYARVVPITLEEDALIPALAPFALALAYGGWVTTRIRSYELRRRVLIALWVRRFVLLGIAAIGTALVIATVLLQTARGGWEGSGDSWVGLALPLMLVPSFISYAKDRDAELAFLMVGIALVATVPVVVLGRGLYVILANGFYEIAS